MEKNIALIGAGYWGQNHLRCLNSLGVLHTVVDSNSERINVIRKGYPHIHFTIQLNDVLENKNIKSVVIAVPAISHYEITKKCLISGKDVLVEKPLALNTAQGEELVEIAQNQGKILMVGHILQYHPAVIRLKQLIDEGELGDLRYIYSNRLNIGKLRIEENVLWSFAPHDISLILMLTGQEPSHVHAHSGSFINKDIYDVTLTVLDFKNNLKGHIFVSWLHPFKEQKVVVVGSKKMAVFDDISKEKLFIYPHKINFDSNNIPIAEKADHYSIQIENKEPLKEEALHFIECVEKRRIPKTDGNEGLRVLKILEIAEKSLKINR